MSIKKNLRIDLKTGLSDNETAPKKIEIRNSKFNLLDSSWVTHGDHYTAELDPGLYIVTMSFASGHSDEKVIEILPNRDTFTLSFENLFKKEPSIIKSSIVDPIKIKKTDVDVVLWQCTKMHWDAVPLSTYKNAKVNEDRISFQLDLDLGHRYLIQVRTKNSTSKPVCVCIPYYNSVVCEIERSRYAEQIGFPFSITFQTENKVADSMASLLLKGSMEDAKKLLPAQQAEDLLFGKVQDPSAAAVGGYCLLKVEKYDRMHNWGQNLANWFPLLPDGPVIYAWQLLKEQSYRTTKNERVSESVIDNVRFQILEGYNRGIPVYTEGLRLMLETFNLLSFHFKEYNRADSVEIDEALKLIRRYASAADWTTPTTTFFGEPNQPL